MWFNECAQKVKVGGVVGAGDVNGPAVAILEVFKILTCLRIEEVSKKKWQCTATNHVEKKGKLMECMFWSS